jgi:hypothetical protein
MKTARKSQPSPKTVPGFSPENFARYSKQWLADFSRLPLAKKKALLIKWDILNPDGTVRRYPMDHIPLGPRS